ncbi:MAG: winged helix-turn-helix transcriptional regulator [Acidobacteria bacterium]|nr:winged helix-turn-helix transcriptional regulator [Acidobacteriota bacterium]
MLFAALGDDTRLMLLTRLSQDGPASITVLADRFRLTRQGVTKHLQVLEAAGVIAGERVGREHIWSLNPGRLALARQHLETITRGWDGALARLQAFCEEEG